MGKRSASWAISRASSLSFSAFTALLIASCGQANRGLVPLPTSSAIPTATPIAAPSSAAQTVVIQATVSLPAASAGATPLPVALATVAGYAPTMSFPLPQSPTVTQLTTVTSNVAFMSMPPLSIARLMQAVRPSALSTNAAALLYIQIYTSATIAVPGAPGFTIAIPSVDVFPNANYYLALYDPTRPSLGWQYGFEGPGALSGTIVSFASNPSPFTFQAALSYYFALFVIPQNSTQPTPAPSTAPTSVPTQSPPPATTSPTPAPTAGGTVIIESQTFTGVPHT